MAVERQGVWRRCEVEHDEPGDAQFKPERFDHVLLALDRAHDWAQHCISLDYVNA